MLNFILKANCYTVYSGCQPRCLLRNTERGCVSLPARQYWACVSKTARKHSGGEDREFAGNFRREYYEWAAQIGREIPYAMRPESRN